MIAPALFLAAVNLTVALTDARRRRHEAILREAVEKSELRTMDRASQEAEINPSQFARQVAMVEGSHKRLVMLPDTFWQWYAVAIAKVHGVPKEIRIGRRLERAAVQQKRMAKAALVSARGVKAS